MKSTVILALFLMLSLLRSPAAEWGGDFEQAKAQAKKENKLILLDFTGSDWCAACKKLKREVFSTPEFAEYAKQHFVLVEVDFPMKKKLPPAQQKANERLEKQFEVEGYPTVVIADAEGRKLGAEEGYAGGGPAAYLQVLDSLMGQQSR